MHDGESPSELVDAFWTVARRLRHVSAASLARWDLTPSQARALAATAVVAGRADRKLVERGPDPGDRRATRLRLTDDGARTADGVRSARGEELEELFGHLSAADRSELTRILGELRSHVERDLPDAAPDGARSAT